MSVRSPTNQGGTLSTITKNALREIIADVLREHRGSSPGECADQIMEALHRFSPKSFVDERVDYSSDDRYTMVAEEMIRAQAFNIDTWEIRAFKPNFTDEEVQLVDDAIGAASISVSF
jgi:hypothetical protein